MQYIKYYLVIILLTAIYFVAEHFDLLALAFPFLIAAGLWLIANLIPTDKTTDEWKNSRWFWGHK